MKLLITILFLVLPPKIWGDSDCGMTLNLTNATIVAQSSEQVVEQNFTISRSSSNNNRCAGYRLFFSKGLANSYQRQAFLNSHTYRYQLHQNTNRNGILKDFNDANSSREYVSGSTPRKNTPYTGSFFVYIPATSNQNSPLAGNFRDNLQVAFYRVESDGDVKFEGIRAYTVNIIVPNDIKISLVDEGGGFDASATSKILDFGFLELNQQLGADLIVQSNTPYQVNISSMNNGAMKFNNSAINYEFKVNGAPVDLAISAASPVSVASGTPSSAGNRINLKVRITSPTEGKIAGLYQDVITITTIAN